MEIFSISLLHQLNMLPRTYYEVCLFKCVVPCLLTQTWTLSKAVKGYDVPLFLCEPLLAVKTEFSSETSHVF